MALVFQRTIFIVGCLSFISIGALQLYSKEVLIGRPTLGLGDPSSRLFIAWIVGIMLIGNGVLAVVRPSTPLVVSLAVFITVYAVIPNVWRFIHGDTGIALTNFGKGISLTAGLMVIHLRSTGSSKESERKIIIRSCTYAFGFFLMVSGIQHFLYAPFVMTLIPTWIPFPLFWTYASGTLLVVGGICLLINIKVKIVALLGGLMILSWVILIHIPRAFVTVRNLNEWLALCEAVAFSLTLFLIARDDSTSEVRRHRLIP